MGVSWCLISFNMEAPQCKVGAESPTLRRMSDFGCENAAAIASAPNILATMDDLATKRCDWQPEAGYPSGLLGPSCHLFARKWDKWTSEAMMDLLELEESLSMLDSRSGACLRPQPPLLSDL